MSGTVVSHVIHHVRFYGAAALGVAVYALAPGDAGLRLLAAGDAAFAAYLLAMGIVAYELKPHDLRARAAREDEGIALLLLIVFAAISFCLAAVFQVLSVKKGLDPAHLALAVASVPLGWATLHTVAAFHYAYLYYAPESGAAPGTTASPLIFPATDCPEAWDFLYFAFVIGMTFQVSDVQIAAPLLRRATLGHSVVSFFFNTAILAMAVNAAVNLTS